MNAEPEQPDPHEVKVLADILALVLEDQPGPSTVALEAIRRKARQNRVTGGALKNLFQAIAANPPAATPSGTEFDHVPDDPRAMRASMERLRATNRNLERALAAANTEAAGLRGDFDLVQSRLIEAQKLIRGLAERVRSGRTKAVLAGAGIATCVAVLAGAVYERVQNPSAPRPAVAQAAPEPPATQLAAAAPQPLPVLKRAANPEPGGSAMANDAELQQALRRLSRTAHPGEPPPEPGQATSAQGRISGGFPQGASSALPPEIYKAVIQHVSSCWRVNVGRLGDVRHQAHLRAVADAEGVMREAKLVPEDLARLSDPSFQEFADAAIRSVLDPQCAQLPIPEGLLGRRIAFDFVFVP
jgi:hypothetical protein